LSWRPSSGVEAAKLRATMLGQVRDYFAAQNVLSVDTPALGVTSVTDPNIESFALANNTYLQTSPEYYMKRLLAAGYPDIYSISRVFRAAEQGRNHLPEFTLIEWYRRNFGLRDIVDDSLRLLAHLLGERSISVLDYEQAFRVHADLDPARCSIADLAHCADADAALCRSLGERRDAWLDLVLSQVVAPGFDASGFTVLQHYPASQASLARLCPANPGHADRFEIFCGTLELANGYVELQDSTLQAARMLADLEARSQSGLAALPIDQQLLAALEAGLPDCAGVALGFERVQMVRSGATHIRDVITFF
jgi:lysyl-tRNA synthetase class 2